MNFRTTYILFGILLAVLALFLLSQVLGPRLKEDLLYVLPSLHEEKIDEKDIATVEIDASPPRYPQEKLTFTRSGRAWRIQPLDVRADRFAVDQIIGDVFRASREENAVDVTSDLKQFGLDRPGAVVTLKKLPDHEWKLNLGDQSGGGDSAVVYVTSSDRTHDVMAVRRSQLGALFVREPGPAPGKGGEAEERYRLKTASDFRSRELLGEGVVNLPDSVEQLSLRPAGAPAVVLKKAEGTRWRFEEPKLGAAQYDGEPSAAGENRAPAGVRDLLRDLADVKVSSTAKDQAKPGAPGDAEGTPDFVADDVSDMAKYGLEADKPATLRIDLIRKGGVLDGTDESEPVKECLLIGKKDGDKYFARLESEKSVVKVEAKKIEPLLSAARDPNVLRSRDLVDIDEAKVDAIDVKPADAPLVRLRRVDQANWNLFVGDAREPRKADYQSVHQLLHALDAKRLIQDFPAQPEAQLGFGPNALTVAVWVEGLQPQESREAEKKDDKTQPADRKPDALPRLKDEQHPTVRLVFGRRTDKQVFVRREGAGEQVVAAVPATVLDKVNQGPLAYLDRVLPSFSESADVIKLAVERRGETLVLDREQKGGKSSGDWRFQQPNALAGRKVDAARVESTLRALRGLSTEKPVAADHPSEAQAEKFGLKSPQARATVTVREDGKTTRDYTYLFGGEAPDKTGIYAKQQDDPRVLVVSASVLDPLQAEFQDPTIFQFSADDARSVKATGWEKAQGFTVTLDAERKPGGAWAVKEPRNFELDESKLNGFLGTLAHLQAQRFVRDKGPKPEALKLDDRGRALQIDVAISDKRTYALTVGDWNAKEKAYYAKSTNLPGTIFLLPEEPFKDVLAGVKYFRKGQ